MKKKAGEAVIQAFIPGCSRSMQGMVANCFSGGIKRRARKVHRGNEGSILLPENKEAALYPSQQAR